jgi:hypothetical protein
VYTTEEHVHAQPVERSQPRPPEERIARALERIASALEAANRQRKQ